MLVFNLCPLLHECLWCCTCLQFLFLLICANFTRKWMSMIAFTKEIWRAMAMQVYIFREVGRSLMAVEFFISATSNAKTLFVCFLLFSLHHAYLKILYCNNISSSFSCIFCLKLKGIWNYDDSSSARTMVWMMKIFKSNILCCIGNWVECRIYMSVLLVEYQCKWASVHN